MSCSRSEKSSKTWANGVPAAAPQATRRNGSRPIIESAASAGDRDLRLSGARRGGSSRPGNARESARPRPLETGADRPGDLDGRAARNGGRKSNRRGLHRGDTAGRSGPHSLPVQATAGSVSRPQDHRGPLGTGKPGQQTTAQLRRGRRRSDQRRRSWRPASSSLSLLPVLAQRRRPTGSWRPGDGHDRIKPPPAARRPHRAVPSEIADRPASSYDDPGPTALTARAKPS